MRYSVGAATYRALGAAFFVSMIGGLIGAAALLGTILIVRPFVLALGSPELFMLALLGLSMVGILSRGSPIAGLLAGAIGLLLGGIGAAPATANYRFTFDTLYLLDGIPLVVIALGVFALPEMVDLLIERRSIAATGTLGGSRLDGVRDALRNKGLVVRSALLGNVIGIIPGLGGSVVDWITYGIAQQTSTDTGNFGKGDIRGVIAPESANNAKESGTLVPTLLFGIPGSPTAAILLGGLILLGLQAGPSMVGRNLDVTLSIIWTLALANVFAAAACLALTTQISKISLIPAQKLVPFLFVIMVFAAYQATRDWGDIIALLLIGLLSWVMKQLGWPRAPLIIGFVLSTATERYLFISMSRYGLDWLARPGVMILGALPRGRGVRDRRLHLGPDRRPGAPRAPQSLRHRRPWHAPELLGGRRRARPHRLPGRLLRADGGLRGRVRPGQPLRTLALVVAGPARRRR